MDHGWKRFAALAAAVGAIAVALIVLEPGDDELTDRDQASQDSERESSDGEDVGGSRPLLGGTRNDAAEDEGGPIVLTYAGGEVVGGVETIEATTGEQVTLAVTSDVQEELHVHGVDRSEDLPAGETIETSFTPEAEGVFEIELHRSATVIANLDVSPA